MADKYNILFTNFPGFEPDPNAPVEVEFARLARFKNWRPGSKQWRRQRERILENEFSYHYGTDAAKLQTWQALCHEVQVRPVPDSITKCKKALGKVHVNLVDLINARRTGEEPRRFHSVKALRDYTRKTGKVFPKHVAKEDGFLKALLRQIFKA